ncbi:MAG: nitroreductase family deazaflavin-dependent oxidoreductase [Actinobacteria bacterium]|jgi:deazaflavin-dependent oxidoreductase (nitroreductase family)|nr:nitroreductase family deazaflavin-dependent oxidoreductase [Actinomycetota bacterium]
MPLPKALARFNRVVTNRISRPVAGRVPGFGVVIHKGRRSGREYRTPVNVFRRDGGFEIALTYGPDADWVKNVMAAGGARVLHRGRVHSLTEPRKVQKPRDTAVPLPVRLILFLLRVDTFLFLDDTRQVDQR